jgi:hypothetical protein
MEPVAMELFRSESKDGESIDPFIEPGAITALAALNAYGTDAKGRSGVNC